MVCVIFIQNRNLELPEPRMALQSGDNMHTLAKHILFFAACTASFIAPMAQAQTSPWSVRVGGTAITFHADAQLEVPTGTPFPGGKVGVQNNTLVTLDVGYDVTPDWTLRTTLGKPPTTTFSAGGTLPPAPTGTLGKIVYAPFLATATYNLGNFGALRPYIGGGLAYAVALKTTDGDIVGVKVKDAWGPVLQLGAELPLSGNWSLYADVRKVFLTMKASGTAPALGNPPVSASIKMNPEVYSIGVGYRF